MSWKPQVQVKGEGDKWHDNALRFATEIEADTYAADLYSRWTLTTAHRAIESDDPVNYKMAAGGLLVPVEAEGANNDAS